MESSVLNEQNSIDNKEVLVKYRDNFIILAKTKKKLEKRTI